MIDLDANASTMPDAQVREAMWPYFGEGFGNASSLHRAGRRARRALDAALESLAALIGARADELVLTSGATESIHSVLDFVRAEWPQRGRLVLGATEHAATLAAARRWSCSGGEVVVVPVGRDGVLDLLALAQALQDGRCALLSLIAANNETGVLSPVVEAAQLARAAGALVHIDAAQWVGKLPLSVADWPVDYISFSAHKFHGPQGIGALWIHAKAAFRPLFSGGGQQHERRSGTEPLALAVGMGVAAQLAHSWLAGSGPRMLRQWRDELETGLLAGWPGAKVHAAEVPRLGNTSLISLPGIQAAELLIVLDQRGLLCSAGSACHSGSLHPSPVLEAMGVDASLAASALRLSLSRMNQADEMPQALRLLLDAATHVCRQQAS